MLALVQMIDNFDARFATWAAGLGFPGEALLRLTFAGIAGGLIGLEREFRGRQAGFRTNLLVCFGSALVMIVSIQFALRDWPHAQNVNVNVDPARIAYGVMTGIGFLCAGTIIQHKGSVRGLTTAAGIWCVAAMGLAAGFGLYTLCFAACAMVLVALWLLDHVERFLPKARYQTITVRRKWNAQALSATVEWFKANAQANVEVNSFSRPADGDWIDIRLQVKTHGRKQYTALIERIESDPELQPMAAEES